MAQDSPDDALLQAACSEQAAAREAVELMLTGPRGREQAAALLYRRFGRRILAFLARHRVPDSEAEELLGDVFFKFITTDAKGALACSAVALLWRVVNSVLVDWARRRDAQCRGGGELEVGVDDGAWLDLIDRSHGALDLPGWIKNCVHRATALFQHEHPRQADTLLLFAQGYSNRELAIIQGADPASVDERQENAAKNRVHDARRVARAYFEECKE